MRDRKLLEDAARAAGGIRPDLGSQWNGSGLWFSGNGEGLLWNPLTDDGDALRLAVQLRMSIDCEDAPDEADRNAAVRRAIVLAAANMTPNV